jgi:flavin-binding protein dodecin
MKNEIKMIKVIEVIASSEIGFTEAAQNAVSEAAKTLKNIRSIYIKEMKGHVENDQIVSYAVNAQISFELEK